MNTRGWNLPAVAIPASYSTTIAAANWASTVLPAVAVADLQIPAGAFFAGLAFTLRAGVQEFLGTMQALVAIAAGAALSGLIASPRMALASAVAFAVSELAAFVLYAAMRQRSRVAAIGLSNTLGLLVDSLLFVALAFGSLTYLGGQIVGKVATTVLAIGVLAVVRARRSADPA
jgi:uncharacterized PurR-regulated membrane protein YhhQ (DUF165 family)